MSEKNYLDPSDPLGIAIQFQVKLASEGRFLKFFEGDFLQWTGSHYRVLKPEYVRQSLYDFIAEAHHANPKPRHVVEQRLLPNRRLVSECLDALEANCLLPENTQVPCWIELAEGLPDPTNLVAFKNGLFCSASGRLFDHTPRFLNLHALDFEKPDDPEEPTEFLAFLESILPGDKEAHDTIQEMFGMYISAETRFQKIPLIYGPKRSGKSTLANLLAEIVGSENVCAPSISSLCRQFGIEPLLDKSVAIVGDARLSRFERGGAIVETLLSVSGEDRLTIDRKHRQAVTRKLPTRFLILTNEVPDFDDSSGALASRFLVIQLRHSFYGREDTGLYERLKEELPEIAVWALRGLQRLRARGHFIQPKSGDQVIEDLTAASSPRAKFIEELCEVGDGFEEPCDVLFDACTTWHEQNKLRPPSSITFGKDLRALAPSIERVHHRMPNGKKRPYYRGIRLLK